MDRTDRVKALIEHGAARDEYEARKLIEFEQLSIDCGEDKAGFEDKLAAIHQFVKESIADYHRLEPRTFFSGIAFSRPDEGFAEASFNLLLQVLGKAREANANVSFVDAQLIELKKQVTEVAIKEALANLQKCIETTCGASLSRFHMLTSAVENAKTVDICTYEIEVAIPKLKAEAERCSIFCAASNAYVNPGTKGEGSAWQRSALEKMAETARTPRDWIEVLMHSHGFPFSRGYWREKVAKDPAIANDCLEKLRMHNMEKTEWRKLLKYVVFETVERLDSALAPLYSLLREKSK